MAITPTENNSRNFHPNHSGRKTFDFILGQVGDCLRDIEPFFKWIEAEEIYTTEYLKVVQIYQTERSSIDPTQLAHCDLAYSIVYFGVSHNNLTTLNRIFEGKYNQLFLSYLSFFIKNKPHPDAGLNEVWENFKNTHLENILYDLREKIRTQKSDPTQNVFGNLQWYPNLEEIKEITQRRPFKYYGGHQFKLGHYYRHLFQTVKYIDEQKILKYSEKYENLKTLRAQLSTPEQYLLFFNTISSMGRAWELNKLSDKAFENFNCYLVTKYNFIKNIPDTFYLDLVNIKDYYPLVDFEFGANPIERGNLKKKFR
ncbi:putative phage abortive infection protein [Mucilaginibacter sp. OK098]|uniref:putative phage abortive infection protein n=1 Tax=Mucilaginibacter sp. OK098 TaxID=1855297 RepID=UPI000923D82B|nr:putative phage abortive infection protein [Mucilaginibacter sp. OK098]SHM92342.1 Putative phage abortive infection protein [Mucilaginibacter sp. OK098]